MSAADTPQTQPPCTRVENGGGGGPRTLCDVLDIRADTAADHMPICIDGRIGLTYRQWAGQSKSLAAVLADLPLPHNPTIGLLFDGLDWISYALTYAAVLRLGGTAIHLNGRLPDSEAERRLEECNASWIIHSGTVAPPRRYRSIAMAFETMQERAEPGRCQPPWPPSDIAEIRYTSGTTGPAKGYTVPHSNLLHNRTLDTLEDLSESTSTLVPIWIGDSSSATILTIAITSRGRQIVCLPNDAERMGALIEAHGIQSIMLTPHVARQLAESGLGGRYDISSVRLIALASAPLVPSTMRRLGTMFPDARVQIACAQSEASPALLTSVYDERAPFRVGQPTPTTEIRIMDDHGTPAPDGEVGELWLRTPASKRYFLSDPDTNRLIRQDGWYRTGDLVRKTGNGDIEFFDRKVDSIVVNGIRISSAHLEAAITESPMIRDAAVVAFRREDGASGIAAFLVPREGSTPDAIRHDLGSRLDQARLPHRIILVPELPRTTNGKLLKRHLRLQLIPPQPVGATT